MRNELIHNGQVVSAFRDALVDSKAIDRVPRVLKELLSTKAWCKRMEPGHSTKLVYEFNAFIDFLTKPPVDGIGCGVDFVRRRIRDDLEAMNMLDEALSRPDGGANNPDGCKGKPDEVITVDNIHGDSTSAAPTRPTGTSRQAALRRLRKDAPELLAQVIAGVKSAHAAMVEAGFRRRKTPLDELVSAWRKANSDERQQFLSSINCQQRTKETT